jgi:tetratricopeptide (TPR) repeat protein
MLEGGARDLPARQRTLRATFDWSYQQLDPEEQTLFAWLSVFVGGWTLEAAEEVCTRAEGSPEPRAGRAVLDRLASLVDKSLLRQEEDPTSGEPRFTMLETLQEYALEQLAASGAEGAQRAAHARYFLALAEQAELQLIGPQQATWLARLEREHGNLRAALGWAQWSERSQAEAREREPSVRVERSTLGLRMAAALWRFWSVRGHLSEGRRWLEDLLACQGSHEVSGESAAVRAKALNEAGNLARAMGDYARAAALHQESLTLSQAQGNTPGIAAALNGLGTVVDVQGDYPRARGLYEESLRLLRALGDSWGIASSLHNLGDAARDVGDYARARGLYEESLALRRGMGDTRGIALSLNNLGAIAQAQGDDARATALHEESLALKRTLGDRWGIAYSLHNLGTVAEGQGAHTRARDLYDESLALKRELGDVRGIANSLNNLGNVARELGDDARARELYEESVRLFRTVGDVRGIANSLEGLTLLATTPETEPETLHSAAASTGC